MSALDPELDVAAAAMVAEEARFVVVGGFAVIANRFVRATEDIDLLVPDDAGNDRRVLDALRKLDAVRSRDAEPLRDEHLIGQAHLRATTSAGVVDILRGGVHPLDFETVERRAMRADYGNVSFPVADLRSIVGFKRLADRPRDRNDLIALEEIHGELPVRADSRPGGRLARPDEVPGSNPGSPPYDRPILGRQPQVHGRERLLCSRCRSTASASTWSASSRSFC